MIRFKEASALWVSDGGRVSASDQRGGSLRIQVLEAGPSSGSVGERQADGRGAEAESGLLITSDSGSLTSCTTNTGTGLRASVLIHLPGSC